MKIAVIGSRETEMVHNRLLYGLVSYWVLNNEIRSGLCKKGPDDVVTRVGFQRVNEIGFDKVKNIRLYPPNAKDARLHHLQHLATPEIKAKQKEIVMGLHPNPKALTDWMWDLHCRNLSIISDATMDNPVDIVVYAHPKKIVAGGTKIGVDYAKSIGIETYNVVHDSLATIVSRIEKGQ